MIGLGGMLNITVIIIGNGIGDQILDEAISASLLANVPGKGMNSSVLTPAIDK